MAGPVFDFMARKATLKQQRLDRIFAMMNVDFPAGLMAEEETGNLVATPEAWAFFESVHAAFGLELPRDVNAEAAIGSVVYLAGHIGSKVKLRARAQDVYEIVRKGLTPLEQDFIDALFGDDVARIRELAVKLRVLDKRPSDFA